MNKLPSREKTIDTLSFACDWTTLALHRVFPGLLSPFISYSSQIVDRGFNVPPKIRCSRCFPIQGCKVKGIGKAIDVGDEADNHAIDY